MLGKLLRFVTGPPAPRATPSKTTKVQDAPDVIAPRPEPSVDVSDARAMVTMATGRIQNRRNEWDRVSRDLDSMVTAVKSGRRDY